MWRRNAIISNRRWIILSAILGLYVFTWIGGWASHSKELDARARAMWGEATERNLREGRLATSQGWVPRPVELRTGGPATSVNWCVPVLPGVLLTDSDYVIGPLWAKGGIKIVLFYGFGSVELVTLFGWMS